MKKNIVNQKGITLIALVITIIVLLILASVATYSGMQIIESSKLTTFTAEMKIMQTQVNSLYDQWKRGEINKDTTGKSLNYNSEVQEQTSKVLTTALDIKDITGYRYYDKETIESLGIEGVKQEFFINIETRNVVSYRGLKYKGDMYYTLIQLPDGLYNVDYNPGEYSSPTFEVGYDILGNNKYKITISNIQYEGYIEKWKVLYQLEGKSYWKTSEDLSFIVDEAGIYNIRIENGTVKSADRKEFILDEDNIKITRDTEGDVSVEREITGNTQYINFDINGLENYEVSVEPSLPYAINSNGEYSFNFTLTDGEGVSNTVNYTVTVDSYVDNPDFWLDLDGTAHIELNNVDQNDFYQEFTIAAKIKINQAEQQSKSYMGIWGNHVASSGIQLQFNNKETNIFLVDYTDYYDKWTDIVVTYNLNTKQRKGYFNGVLKVTLNDVTISPYEGFNIGTSYLPSDRQMIGQIACLKIWDKELTAKEVLQIDLLRENINVRQEDSYCNINLKSEEAINSIGTFVGTGYSFHNQ